MHKRTLIVSLFLLFFVLVPVLGGSDCCEQSYWGLIQNGCIENGPCCKPGDTTKYDCYVGWWDTCTAKTSTPCGCGACISKADCTPLPNSASCSGIHWASKTYTVSCSKNCNCVQDSTTTTRCTSGKCGATCTTGSPCGSYSTLSCGAGVYYTRSSQGHCFYYTCSCSAPSWSGPQTSGYCSKCTHCGDGICNCGESSSGCCQDCGCPANSHCSGGYCVCNTNWDNCGGFCNCRTGGAKMCCGTVCKSESADGICCVNNVKCSDPVRCVGGVWYGGTDRCCSNSDCASDQNCCGKVCKSIFDPSHCDGCNSACSSNQACDTFYTSTTPICVGKQSHSPCIYDYNCYDPDHCTTCADTTDYFCVEGACQSTCQNVFDSCAPDPDEYSGEVPKWESHKAVCWSTNECDASVKIEPVSVVGVDGADKDVYIFAEQGGNDVYMIEKDSPLTIKFDAALSYTGSRSADLYIYLYEGTCDFMVSNELLETSIIPAGIQTFNESSQTYRVDITKLSDYLGTGIHKVCMWPVIKSGSDEYHLSYDGQNKRDSSMMGEFCVDDIMVD